MDQADAMAPPHLTRQETDPQTPRNTVTAGMSQALGEKIPEGCGITASVGIRRASWRREYPSQYLQKNCK